MHVTVITSSVATHSNLALFTISAEGHFVRTHYQTTGPCGRGHLALALLTIIKRDRYASESPLRKFATVFSQSKNHYGRQMWYQNDQKSVKFNVAVMGFAVRVRSAGQKYGPTCHQRDRADVTEFVTLMRLSSLGQHVGVLALAGYKRRKSALTAGPIVC